MNAAHRDFGRDLAIHAARYAVQRVIAKDHLGNEDCGDWGPLEDAAQRALWRRTDAIRAWRAEYDETFAVTDRDGRLVWSEN